MLLAKQFQTTDILKMTQCLILPKKISIRNEPNTFNTEKLQDFILTVIGWHENKVRYRKHYTFV